MPVEVSMDSVVSFMGLFQGLETAFGTGDGRWVKRKPDIGDFKRHLDGQGSGIGIAPLRPDNTVLFAAIDLDEPDFDAALEMQAFLPGASFIERSRSGNAHVWVFFKEPVEAWVAMGILREATVAAGKETVEVFPKNHDFSKVKFGNYINLPYHGKDRPVLLYDYAGEVCDRALGDFLGHAQATLQDAEDWRKRARWLMIEPPERRHERSEYGTKAELHCCGEYIIANRDSNPVLEGHRNAVYFALAKMLSNCSLFDHDEALDLIQLVNTASPDRVPLGELRRILANAERGQYTSFGCDDPLVKPYADPNCPIAYPRR